MENKELGDREYVFQCLDLTRNTGTAEPSTVMEVQKHFRHKLTSLRDFGADFVIGDAGSVWGDDGRGGMVDFGDSDEDPV